MKETADRLKDVKSDKNLPESLADLDYGELEKEFTDMTDVAKTFREMDPAKLPPTLRELNFQDLEADFEAMKQTATRLADAPKADPVKEMNFDDVKAGYDTVKGAKSKI
jgi:hypothetical protein